MGVLVTLLFIPEVACLDLSEGDKRWEALKAGKPCCMGDRNHHPHCFLARITLGPTFSHQQPSTRPAAIRNLTCHVIPVCKIHQ